MNITTHIERITEARPGEDRIATARRISRSFSQGGTPDLHIRKIRDI